jgi:hypothetical protein
MISRRYLFDSRPNPLFPFAAERAQGPLPPPPLCERVEAQLPEWVPPPATKKRARVDQPPTEGWPGWDMCPIGPGGERAEPPAKRRPTRTGPPPPPLVLPPTPPMALRRFCDEAEAQLTLEHLAIRELRGGLPVTDTLARDARELPCGLQMHLCFHEGKVPAFLRRDGRVWKGPYSPASQKYQRNFDAYARMLTMCSLMQHRCGALPPRVERGRFISWPAMAKPLDDCAITWCVTSKESVMIVTDAVERVTPALTDAQLQELLQQLLFAYLCDVGDLCLQSAIVKDGQIYLVGIDKTRKTRQPKSQLDALLGRGYVQLRDRAVKMLPRLKVPACAAAHAFCKLPSITL